MSEWKAKRFWKEATPEAVEGGFSVRLDGRPVKTPAKRALFVPTHALAEAIAQEWDAQSEEINPESMPLTRLANSALDKVAPQFAEVAAHLAEYGGSDLLCYRADQPEGLVARQKEAWDPLLDWINAHQGIRLDVQDGIMPVAQPAESTEKLSRITQSLETFELTAFHELVTLPGSWVLGFAVLSDHLSATEAWDIATIDEVWQEEQWGADEEAQEVRAIKRAAFLTGHRFAHLLRAN